MSGNCPCYVKVLGKKHCRQCKGKTSEEFCIPKICMYLSKWYAIRFVSDLRHVGGYHWVLRFPPPITLTDTI